MIAWCEVIVITILFYFIPEWWRLVQGLPLKNHPDHFHMAARRTSADAGECFDSCWWLWYRHTCTYHLYKREMSEKNNVSKVN